MLLGIDQTAPENAVGRSDTIILSTINPLEPYVGLLSIPRDLWVNVPGVGENRINTAHFFAEAAAADSGPLAAMETIHQNFGVDVDYYLRLRFEGFRDVIDAMGGVDLVFPEPMAGYPAGPLHLNGNKALAFTRHRLGSDDFFRMEHTQFLLKATLRQMLSPRQWVRIPLHDLKNPAIATAGFARRLKKLIEQEESLKNAATMEKYADILLEETSRLPSGWKLTPETEAAWPRKVR